MESAKDYSKKQDVNSDDVMINQASFGKVRKSSFSSNVAKVSMFQQLKSLLGSGESLNASSFMKEQARLRRQQSQQPKTGEPSNLVAYISSR